MTAVPTDVDLVRLTDGEMIDFRCGATANKDTLALCPPEVGAYLRLAYRQDREERCYVIYDPPPGIERVDMRVDRRDGQLWFGADNDAELKGQCYCGPCWHIYVRPRT